MDSLTKAEKEILKKLDEKRTRVGHRFPLVTSLIATFGFVSLLYGFEKFIDSVPFLANNPIVLFLVGIVTLVITGTVYKKLG